MNFRPAGRSAASRLLDRLVQRMGRTRMVWLSLVGSMALATGTLLLIERQPASAPAGFPLAATVDAAGGPNIEAIFNTRVPIEPGRWKGVVIHHSGELYGSAADLAALHRARGLHGLGYHFVIGNGAGAGDGELFVGYRWLDQLPGAHAAGPDQDEYNRGWIGVCLVGDGDRRPFTAAQLRRLTELLQSLQQHLGLREDAVLLHRQIAATSSPGRLFPEAELRAALLRAQKRAQAASAGMSSPAAVHRQDAVGLEDL